MTLHRIKICYKDKAISITLVQLCYRNTHRQSIFLSYVLQYLTTLKLNNIIITLYTTDNKKYKIQYNTKMSFTKHIT